jgi:hypothetical protein
MSNDGPKGRKHVVFIDDIIKPLLDSNIYAKTPFQWALGFISRSKGDTAWTPLTSILRWG